MIALATIPQGLSGDEDPMSAVQTRSLRVVYAGIVIASIAWPSSIRATQTDSGSVPEGATTLFETHDLLSFEIRAPLRDILNDRNQESEEHPGTLVLRGSNGDSTSLDIKIRTRGNSRLRKDICNFPPVRLNFQTGQTKQTIFAGQDKLKLVTHCQDGRDEYEQFLLKEYLLYRAFNLLTDLSFRVRLARITYVDSEDRRDVITKYGFLIEQKEMMAARNDREAIKVRVLSPGYVDPEYLSLVEVFQYMIGNPDWSAFAAEKGKGECCHNTSPIGSMQGPVFPVPFDFDITGLVSPRYVNRLYQATPGARVSNVTKRIYRGLCRSERYLDNVFALLRDRRDDIYALYSTQEGLDPKMLKRTIEYFDDFYEVIDDPRKVEREIRRNCRGPRSD